MGKTYNSDNDSEEIIEVRCSGEWALDLASFDDFCVIEFDSGISAKLYRISYDKTYDMLLEIRKKTRIDFFPLIESVKGERNRICTVFLRKEDSRKFIDFLIALKKTGLNGEELRPLTLARYKEKIDTINLDNANRGNEKLINQIIGYAHVRECLSTELPAGGIFKAVKREGKYVVCIHPGCVKDTITGTLFPHISVYGKMYMLLPEGDSTDSRTARICDNGVIGRGGTGRPVKTVPRKKAKELSMPSKKTALPIEHFYGNREETDIDHFKRSQVFRDLFTCIYKAGIKGLTVNPFIMFTKKAWRKKDKKRTDYEIAALRKILITEGIRIRTLDDSLDISQLQTIVSMILQEEYVPYRIKVSDYIKSSEERIFPINTEITCTTSDPSATIIGIHRGTKSQAPSIDSRVRTDSANKNQASFRIDSDSGDHRSIELHFFSPRAESSIQLKFKWDSGCWIKNEGQNPRNPQFKFALDPADVIRDSGRLTLSLVKPLEEDKDGIYWEDANDVSVQHITTENTVNLNAVKISLAELGIRSDLMSHHASLIRKEDIIAGIYYRVYEITNINQTVTCMCRMELHEDGEMFITMDDPALLKKENRYLWKTFKKEYMDNEKQPENNTDNTVEEENYDSNIKTKSIWMGALIDDRPYQILLSNRQMIPYDADRTDGSFRYKRDEFRDEVGCEYGLCWNMFDNDLVYSSGYLADSGDDPQTLQNYPNMYLVKPADGEPAEITPDILHSWLFSSLVRRSQASSATPYPYKYMDVWMRSKIKKVIAKMRKEIENAKG